MVSTFYKGSDGCMLAFDVTDRESFESLDNWRDDFLEKVIPREQDFPMVVLGNKIDICDRQVRVEERERGEWIWMLQWPKVLRALILRLQNQPPCDAHMKSRAPGCGAAGDLSLQRLSPLQAAGIKHLRLLPAPCPTRGAGTGEEGPRCHPSRAGLCRGSILLSRRYPRRRPQPGARRKTSLILKSAPRTTSMLQRLSRLSQSRR